MDAPKLPNHLITREAHQLDVKFRRRMKIVSAEEAWKPEREDSYTLLGGTSMRGNNVIALVARRPSRAIFIMSPTPYVLLYRRICSRDRRGNVRCKVQHETLIIKRKSKPSNAWYMMDCIASL